MQSIKKFLSKFKVAFEGLGYALTKDKSVIIQTLIMSVVLILSILLKLEKYDFIIILSVCFIVLITEIINSSIENLSDYKCNKEESHQIKIVKDLGAAAVLVASIFAVIVGLLIFKDYIF